MNLKELVTGVQGEKQFLLGNEAAVRGVIEAGVSIAATYPGTPSSEIGNVLSVLAKDANIYFEFSTNEKVAMEVAATAAASGLRSFTFMKHVGMNVASDSFMTTAYSGVRGGMVILSADDPSLFSSQNEQDTRNYARLANVPVLEPSNCQEVKDMVKYAFDLSEQFGIPVIVRTTTRVSHMRGVVEFGDVKDNSSNNENHWKRGHFDKDPSKFVPVPAFAGEMHVRLWDKMHKIEEITNKSDLNKEISFADDKKYGVISSSSAYNYAHDVVKFNDLNMDILKLGFSYPFPKEKVAEFLSDLDEVFVVEEVDPIAEKDTLAIIGEKNLNVVVHGKLDGTFSQNGFSTKLVLTKGIAEVKRPQTPKPPYSYVTEDVMFRNEADGATLSGTLTWPVGYDKNAKKKPVVLLLVSGSGQQNRDEELFEHKPFLVIADYLARQGIATLRYDDRATGSSVGGEVKNATTADFSRDAAAGIDFLRSNKAFSKVGILGHSEGGSIAFMLGAQKKVDFIVSLAGPGVKGDTLLVAQANRILSLSGQPAYMTVEKYRQQEAVQQVPWIRWFCDYDCSQWRSRQSGTLFA